MKVLSNSEPFTHLFSMHSIHITWKTNHARSSDKAHCDLCWIPSNTASSYGIYSAQLLATWAASCSKPAYSQANRLRRAHHHIHFLKWDLDAHCVEVHESVPQVAHCGVPSGVYLEIIQIFLLVTATQEFLVQHCLGGARRVAGLSFHFQLFAGCSLSTLHYTS